LRCIFLPTTHSHNNCTALHQGLHAVRLISLQPTKVQLYKLELSAGTPNQEGTDTGNYNYFAQSVMVDQGAKEWHGGQGTQISDTGTTGEDAGKFKRGSDMNG